MNSLDRYLADREEHEITEQRDITLERNPTVDDICREYEGWLGGVSEDTTLLEDYTNGLKYLKGLEYTAQEVREFSIKLKQYEDAEFFQYTGFFLSALVNTCPDEEFEIITEHLETPIYCIGYKNTKQVTVNGNAGNWVGDDMEGGSITVKGDAGDRVGWGMEGGSITVKGNAGEWVGDLMKGGSITVKGNAGDHVGYCMEGGSITVKGNAGEWVGDLMKGGSIRIKGEFEGISNYWQGGEIYHKGKRVRPE